MIYFSLVVHLSFSLAQFTTYFSTNLAIIFKKQRARDKISYSLLSFFLNFNVF